MCAWFIDRQLLILRIGHCKKAHVHISQNFEKLGTGCTWYLPTVWALEELTKLNFIWLLPPPLAVRKIGLEGITVVIKSISQQCRRVHRPSAHHSPWERLPVEIRGGYFLPLSKKSKATCGFDFGLFRRSSAWKAEPHSNERQSGMKNCCVATEPECRTLARTKLRYFRVEETMLLPSLALFCYLFCFLGCIATCVSEEEQ